MKNILIIFISIVCAANLNSQTMSNGTITSCSGTLLDPGGTGNYPSSSLVTQTICSGTPGSQIQIDFGVLALEQVGSTCYDYIVVYEGTTTTGAPKLFNTCSGDPSPITSTTGCLTIVFRSDGSSNNSGFSAPYTCVSCSDGIKNGTETSVDCGGPSCPTCPNCYNGIQDGNETSIDVGPSCPNASHCNNGIMDGDETSVDCGGSCVVCPVDCNVTIQATTTTGCCDYTLKLYDSGNDGWKNSAKLEVFKNNVSVGSYIPTTTTNAFTTYTFNACNGDEIKLSFTKSTSTTQNNQIGIQLLDPAGTVLYNLATNTNPATNANLFKTTANCPPALSCNGGQVKLIATGVGATIKAMDNDFDGGTAGSGWTASTAATYTNPCLPSVDGQPYMWMGNASPTPRAMETTPLDLSCGGKLCFLLAYAVQGNNSPCEGPDEPDEGVVLQYSTNGGSTWTDMSYWHPNGTMMTSLVNTGSGATGPTVFTDWKEYCFDLPAAAITNYTSIRWIQPNGTAASNDHWGIDNVTISSVLNCAPYVYDWNNIAGVDNGSTQTVNVTGNQTFNVTYTNQAGDACSTSVNITIPNAVIPNASVTQHESCVGANDGSATVTATGGSGTYTYSWNTTPVQATQTATGLGAGTYIVTVTDGSGCSAKDTVVVNTTQKTEPTFTAQGPYCKGTSFTLPASSSNGFAGTWSPAVNNQATTTYLFTPNAGLCADTTRFTIQISNLTKPTFNQHAPICSGGNIILPTTSSNGTPGTWTPLPNNMATTTYIFTPNPGFCADTASMKVTVGGPVQATFDPITAICTGESFTLPTTSKEGFTGTWSPALNNTATTTYTFTITAGQCATNGSLSVTVNQKTEPTFTQHPSICSGGTINLPTTSTNSITGTWSPATNNTVTTKYVFTPTTGQCADTASMTVVVGTPPPATFDTILPKCKGDVFTLPTTSKEGFTGSWSPAVNVNTTTTYTFTPTAGQCAVGSTKTVAINQPVEPTFTQHQPICAGGIINLPTSSTNTVSITGTWSPAPDNTTTTTYLFTPDAGQCADTTRMKVVVGPPVTPTFTQVSAICKGGSFTLPTTSNESFTGTWSPAVNNQVTTQYTFTPGTGQCANTTTMTVTVNQPTHPSFVQVAPICSGGAFTLPTTSTQNITGSWAPPINNTDTTTYTFTPAANQCAVDTTMTVAVKPLPTIITNGPLVECTPNSVDLTASAVTTGSTSGTSFTYFSNPALTTAVATPSAVTQSNTYYIKGTKDNCSNSASIDVQINASPVLQITDPAAKCTPNTVDITAPGITTGSTLGVTLSYWRNPLATQAISQSEAAMIDSAGTYYIVATKTSCTDTAAVVVTINQTPTVNAGIDTIICNGSSVTLTASGAASYSWTGGVQNGVAFSPSNTANYTVTGTTNGCSSSDIVTVTVVPLPNVNAGVDILGCAGDSITLTASGADSIVWTNGVVDGVKFAQAQGVVSYTATGYNLAGCVDTDDITVTMDPQPTIDFIADKTRGCSPLTVMFTNNTANSAECNWNFGNGTTASGCGTITKTFTQSGCYDITLNLKVGACGSSKTMNDYICVDETPVASFIPSQYFLSEFNTAVEFDNNSTGATNYIWNFGDGTPNTTTPNPMHDFVNAPIGPVQVTLVASANSICSDTTFVNLYIQEALIYYIPNSFTPDQDIYNPEFKPIFTSGFDPYNYQMQIYNRWGEMVFETNDIHYGWDGSYGSNVEVSKAQEGVYTYKIQFKLKETDEHRVSVGHVNLLR
jgi:gliding motility-associated-like protein